MADCNNVDDIFTDNGSGHAVEKKVINTSIMMVIEEAFREFE